jgi:glutamate-1-semialdehyde 2,1-aminomutase
MNAHRRSDRETALVETARRVLPAGSFGNVPFDMVIAEGRAGRVWDASGNEYVDLLLGSGPMFLGHAHPEVTEAVREQLGRGTTFFANSEPGIRLAAEIVDAVACAEMVRFVSSGTEATMTALRLARAFTRRDVILKFDGGYHGHADGLLVKAGSGPLTLGQPDSPGVPAVAAAQTLSVPYNDVAAVRDAFDAHPGQIAAVIVEPVAGNMGVIPPEPGFLEHLRSLTRQHGALLIFDEVITGFRVALGGAQERFRITPDLTCLGKIVGGGLPVGAYGGRREIMEMVSPLGPVYQAGTLSGNPLAMAAGLATLRLLTEPGVYDHLERLSARLVDGLGEAAREAGVAYTANRVGSMFTGFFTSGPVTDYASARRSSTRRYARFFHAMLERGVYLAPSQFEAGFMSLAHAEADVEATLKAAAASFAEATLVPDEV